MYYSKEVEEFASRLVRWREDLADRRLPAVLPLDGTLRNLVRFASDLERRYREGLGAAAAPASGVARAAEGRA